MSTAIIKVTYDEMYCIVRDMQRSVEKLNFSNNKFQSEVDEMDSLFEGQYAEEYKTLCSYLNKEMAIVNYSSDDIIDIIKKGIDELRAAEEQASQSLSQCIEY